MDYCPAEITWISLAFQQMEHSSQRTKNPRELLVFHQALGVFPRCLRYNYCTEKMASNISPIFALSSSVHPLRLDCKIIWSMIEWSNGSYSLCINRIYEFSPNILQHAFLIWIKKSWVWHFGSGLKRLSLYFFDFRTTGACIRSTDLVIFDLLVSQWIYDLIFNCPLTLHLYLWLLLSLLLLKWDCSFFNYLPPGSAGKTATPQSPAAPGESIPCWDHPLLAWVGDERNSERQKNGDE